EILQDPQVTSVELLAAAKQAQRAPESAAGLANRQHHHAREVLLKDRLADGIVQLFRVEALDEPPEIVGPRLAFLQPFDHLFPYAKPTRTPLPRGLRHNGERTPMITDLVVEAERSHLKWNDFVDGLERRLYDFTRVRALGEDVLQFPAGEVFGEWREQQQ